MVGKRIPPVNRNPIEFAKIFHRAIFRFRRGGEVFYTRKTGFSAGLRPGALPATEGYARAGVPYRGDRPSFLIHRVFFPSHGNLYGKENPRLKGRRQFRCARTRRFLAGMLFPPGVREEFPSERIAVRTSPRDWALTCSP